LVNLLFAALHSQHRAGRHFVVPYLFWLLDSLLWRENPVLAACASLFLA